MTPRPFRFIAPMPRLTPDVPAWQAEIRHIEDLGFSAISVSEHLAGGWSMEPLVALAAAANVTSRIRLLTLVLANDFHHPVLLHKAIATLDVLTGGRVELGLGTGWQAADYAASGIPFDPIELRIERLAESIAVLKGLFGTRAVTFAGSYYHIAELEGRPAPVQLPHPPLMIGGGGRRILALAAREADIVGIHARLGAGAIDETAAADLDAHRIAEKVDWVRASASEAGRDAADFELQFSVYLSRVTSTQRRAAAAVSSFAEVLGADPGLVNRSPAVLIGTIDECVARLVEHRERFGLSYWNLGGDIAAVAPIVARLAGT